MALPTINPTQTAAWQKLQAHFAQMKTAQMQDLFATDAHRTEKFHIEWKDFLLDYSKNIVSEETMALLQELAGEVDLKSAIEQYFGGGLINQTENRAVLHTALRSKQTEPILVDGKDILPEIAAVNTKIAAFSESII